MSKTSARQWAQRIRRWQRSGLTASEFGDRHGIDSKQLSWWKWQLKKRGELADCARSPGLDVPTEDSTAIHLLPVHVVDAPAQQPEIAPGRSVEIGLRNGRVVRVAHGTDLGWLADILAVTETDGGSRC